MARQRRLEFAGAFCHVMDRGDRREPIVEQDADRWDLVETLAGFSEGDLARLPGSHPAKVQIAGVIWAQTTVTQGRIAGRLAMGSAGNVSQQTVSSTHSFPL